MVVNVKNAIKVVITSMNGMGAIVYDVIKQNIHTKIVFVSIVEWN